MSLLPFAAVAVLAGAAALVGCQAREKIPAQAKTLTTANGEFTYVAEFSGRLYIWNDSWKQLDFAGEVQRGQAIHVNTDTHQISIDGRPVAHAILGEGNRYELFILLNPEVVMDEP